MTASTKFACLLIASFVFFTCFALGEDQNTYRLIHYPGSESTFPYAINTQGDVVGWYQLPPSGWPQGFLFSDGVYTTVDVPGAATTYAYGINDAKHIVGFYQNGSIYHGFFFDGQSFTDIDYPGGDYGSTFPVGINNNGQIIGWYAGTYNSRYGIHGFVLSNGQYTTLDAPGDFKYGSYLIGINNLGGVVGEAKMANTHVLGFRFGSGGAFRPINVPGPFDTHPTGINDNGVIVGYYDAPPHEHCFTLVNGQFHRLTFPGGASLLYCTGINASGQVVGWSEGGKFQGFLITPGK